MAESKLTPKPPRSSRALLILLLWCSSITATTLGYDSSMMTGLNILPSYTDYFHLDTTTLALQSAIGWAGTAVAGVFYGQVTDKLGRKKALWIAAGVTLIGVVLQAASQNIAMFVIARFVVGLGNGCAFLSGPVYLAETMTVRSRAVGIGIFMAFFYAGGLLAAGITYGTAKMLSTWAWRLPSAIQGVLTIISLIVLPYIPESPRWLIHRSRHEEALEIVADLYADGNHEDPVVLAAYKEMHDTIIEEANQGQRMSPLELLKNKPNLRRLALCMSVAVITMLSGNNIVSYYLGSMLDNAGITNTNTQLQINIALNAWCLVCALIGTFSLDKVGRKPLAVISCIAMTILIFLVGAFTKLYGQSGDNSHVYATVALIFLFQGSYSIAWTPLAQLYPPEILNFAIRSTGMGVYTFASNGFGLMATMAFPYALNAIGWKTYMINGAWDVLQVIYVWIFWVETKGRSLEEIDWTFEGKGDQNTPYLSDVMHGVDPGLSLHNGTEVVAEEAVVKVLHPGKV